MSLFSRLDRIRNTGREKEAQDETGMFGTPDLGPRAESPAAPPLETPARIEEPTSPIAAIPVTLPPREDETPQSLAPETQTNVEGEAAPIEASNTPQPFAPVELAPAETGDEGAPIKGVTAPKVTNFEVTAFDSAMSASEPVVAEPGTEARRSPFERLMVETPAPSTSSTPAVGPLESERPRTLIERLQARDGVNESASPAPAGSGESAPTENATPAFTSAAFEGADLPSISVPSPPATPAVSMPNNESIEHVTSSPRSVEPVPTPSAAPTPPSAPQGIFAQRLAARETLDRDLQIPSNEPAPRVPADLARLEDEAPLPEKEMKVRVLYRQKHLIFDSVLGALDPRAMQNPTRETLKPSIEKSVDGALREFNLALDSSERNWMVEEFLRETTDVGALVPMLEDPGVSKIIITGANDVSVEKLGQIQRTGISFRDDDHLLLLVRRIAEMTGGRIDAKVPLLDRPLPDGGRIRAKVPPLAPQPTLTIEKSTGNPFVALKRQQAERSRGEALPYNQLRERIQLRLLREFEGNSAMMTSQDRLRGQVEEMIGQVIIEEKIVVTRAEKAALVMDLLNEIVGLGPIEPLLNDPDVDEIMVNGPYQIYVERRGKLELSNQRFRDNNHAMQVIERIIAPLGRRIDEKSPMVDGRLRDGSRFNAIIPPLALTGPTMTIRKFARDPYTMTDLVNFGTLTREAAQFLQAAVEGRLNVVVSGGTGSGKTTTLNVLSSFIPSTERIVTIEDAAELQMRQEHVIRLETRPANIEGIGEITIRDLVKNALRMRPDRIVIGECRGGEALDMLQAMNTGHDGSLTTGHSNGPRDTLKRLETMVMMSGFDLPVKAIREQIAMAVHIIVHQERMRDGKRRISAITEIVGMEGDVITMQDLFRFEQERIDDDGKIIGTLQPTGLRPKHWDQIADNGVEISMEMFQRRTDGVSTRLNGHRIGSR